MLYYYNRLRTSYVLYVKVSVLDAILLTARLTTSSDSQSRDCQLTSVRLQSYCSRSNNTNLLLHLITAVLGMSIFGYWLALLDSPYSL